VTAMSYRPTGTRMSQWFRAAGILAGCSLDGDEQPTLPLIPRETVADKRESRRSQIDPEAPRRVATSLLLPLSDALILTLS
jgi:hypothetical protein